jgi:CHAD domain.
MRAWIRLVRNEDDAAGGLRAIDQDLRAIMKQLSARRDRQALQETLRWLEKKAKDGVQSSVQSLHSHMQSSADHRSLDWLTIKASLLGVLEKLDQLARVHDYSHTLRDGLQRTYKRASKYGDVAFSSKMNPDDLHTFRKWSKYLLYQLVFVQTYYPELYKETQELLKELGDRLGRFHDLNLLKERFEKLPASKHYADASKRTGTMIDIRMHKLLKRSSRLYRKIFSGSPSRFVEELA